LNSHNLDKNVLIFSTYASFREGYHTLIKEKFVEKGCTIIGEFSCLGAYGGMLGLNRDLKGALGWIVGRIKGHPDERDVENARASRRVF
jgi:flavodoxin